MIELFRETYRFRELIWALALKELRVRYKRSVLGFLWALLNPALLMLVMTLVFGTIMRFAIPHYAIFLLSVLLPWTFFTQSLAYSVESIVGNAELLKKVYVAKLVFPLKPMVYLLNGFRLGNYYCTLPSLQSAAMALLCGVLALVIGFYFFRRYQNTFVYYV